MTKQNLLKGIVLLLCILCMFLFLYLEETNKKANVCKDSLGISYEIGSGYNLYIESITNRLEELKESKYCEVKETLIDSKDDNILGGTLDKIKYNYSRINNIEEGILKSYTEKQ